MPSIISTHLFAIALFLFSGEYTALSKDTDVRECYNYSQANTTAATCNEVPGLTCSGGCTGYVTAHNCTRSTKINVQEPPITTEKCTLGFGKSSATMYICINEAYSFTCYGSSEGKAECKGCSMRNSTTNGNATPPTVPTTNSSSTGTTEGASQNNSTAGAGGPSTPSPAPTTAANAIAFLAVSSFSTALFL